MSGTLDHWIGGTPAVGAGVNSGRFTHWLHGAPLIHFGSAIPRVDAGYIVTAAPHWTEPVELTVRLPTSRTRSLSGAEARRPFASSLRVQLKWSSVMSARELHAVREQIRSSGNQTFVAPLWPLMLDGAAWTPDARVRGGLLLAFNADFAQWDFSTTGTLEDAVSWDFVVPAVVGRLSVKASALGPAAAMVEFTFTEDAEFDYALVVDPETWPAGATLSDGTTPPVFPIETLWQSAPATGTAELDIERKQIGHTRQMASADYGAAPEHGITAEAMLDSHREVARLLRWLLDRSGDVGAQLIDTLVDAGPLALPAAAGTTAIDLLDAANLGPSPVLLLDDLNGTRECVRVSAVSGNRVTTAAPLAHSWAGGNATRVSLAILARFTKPEILLRFLAPNVAMARLAWREVPPEYSPVSEETRGATLGALPECAWLYELVFDRAGASSTYRFTGYERDLTDGLGNVWTSHPIEHSGVGGSARMDRDDGRITMRYTSPLDRFLPGRNDGIVRARIYRAEVNGGAVSSATLVFTGQATGFQSNGPFAEIALAGASALFDRPIPRILIQRTCNHVVYDAGCGLAVSTWTFQATVDSAAAGALTVKGFSLAGGLPTGWGFTNYFALGYVERTSGERLLIAANEALDGPGRVTLYLVAVPVSAFLPNEAVSLVPGCDGNPTTCKGYAAGTNPIGKFDNYARFGGFPFVPAKNPEFKPIDDGTTTGTGKK